MPEDTMTFQFNMAQVSLLMDMCRVRDVSIRNVLLKAMEKNHPLAVSNSRSEYRALQGMFHQMGEKSVNRPDLLDEPKKQPATRDIDEVRWVGLDDVL